jgi:hypothetical protein
MPCMHKGSAELRHSVMMDCLLVHVYGATADPAGASGAREYGSSERPPVAAALAADARQCHLQDVAGAGVDQRPKDALALSLDSRENPDAGALWVVAGDRRRLWRSTQPPQQRA